MVYEDRLQEGLTETIVDARGTTGADDSPPNSSSWDRGPSKSLATDHYEVTTSATLPRLKVISALSKSPTVDEFDTLDGKDG